MLALAHPQRFRDQLAAGRVISELGIDVRLAFGAVRRAGKTVDLFRVMLIQDELERRSTALAYAPALVEAFLAVGDLDASQRYVETYGGGAYELIDALVEAGEIDRARAVFDQAEPVVAGGTNDLGGKEKRLDDWSHRVHLFAILDQIIEAIDRIAADEAAMSGVDAEALAARLRSDVARSAIASRPSTEPEELVRLLGLDPKEIPFLLAQAAFSAAHVNSDQLGNDLLIRTLAHPAIETLPDSWRRRLALLAWRRGRHRSGAQGVRTRRPAGGRVTGREHRE